MIANLQKGKKINFEPWWNCKKGDRLLFWKSDENHELEIF